MASMMGPTGGMAISGMLIKQSVRPFLKFWLAMMGNPKGYAGNKSQYLSRL